MSYEGKNHRSVILFDGVCNFCNGAVNYVIDRDPEGYFHFASLQSNAGKDLLRQFGKDAESLDTLILIEEDHCYTRSTAALRIAKRLQSPLKLAYCFIIIPSPIRDIFYRLFARSRYRLFGKRETCRIPTADERSRFIE